MKLIKSLFFLLMLLSSCAFGQQQPNIVLIISDDHAYQSIGAYGSPYGRTPNIDMLAKQYTIFKK